MQKITLTIISALLFLGTGPALAKQQWYVTDRIVLDMYEDSSRLSQVLRQLPTGTAMDLLQNNGPFAQVRLADGTTGWVEGSFLTDEKPIQVLYTEVNKKLKKSQARIAELESAENSNTDNDNTADTREVERLRGQVSSAREKTREMESELKQSQTLLHTANGSISALQEENGLLREQLENLTSKQSLQSGVLASHGEPLGGNRDFAVPLLWFGVGILVFLIIGIVAGIALLDWRIRQRHGGFRIY